MAETAKSTKEIGEIIGKVEYKNWTFHVVGDADRLFLQVAFNGNCSKTGLPNNWKGRKWDLSRYMTKSELVQTAFKAVLTAEEHEAREAFLYKGRPIFEPHFDVDALWQIATTDNEDVRK
jgi:hypothetical protein